MPENQPRPRQFLDRKQIELLAQPVTRLTSDELALMIQQFTAIEWSTEPQPFPRLLPIGSLAALTLVIRCTAKERTSSVRWSKADSQPASTFTGSTTRSTVDPWLSR